MTDSSVNPVSDENNYFKQVVEYFTRLRGKHLSTCPMDWILIEKWLEQGIPLKVVYRGLEDTAYAKRSRTNFNLQNCDKYVQKNWETYRQLLIGKNDYKDNSAETPAQVVQRLLPLLEEEVISYIKDYLIKHYPGNVEKILNKIKKLFSNLVTKARKDFYKDYDTIELDLETMHRNICRIITGTMNNCCSNQSVLDECKIPRVDLASLFSMED